ncbi:MAG: hypothetical protein MI757_03485 [Pirellulales bacterium]|nr:hypothetical protein [Pirellulales bacterium]
MLHVYQQQACITRFVLGPAFMPGAEISVILLFAGPIRRPRRRMGRAVDEVGGPENPA